MPRDVAAVPVSAILLVALTVGVTGAATTVLLLQEPSQDPVAAGFTLKDGDRVEILKTSGDALDAEPTTLYVGTPEGSASIPADEVPGIGDTWTNGQSACLAGEGPRCLEIVGAEDIIDVRIAHVDQTLYSWDEQIEIDDIAAGDGPRLSVGDSEEESGGAGIQPDLRLVSVEADPEAPAEGEEVTFSVTVANVGSQATGQDATVRVELGGSTHDEVDVASLEDGASTTIETSPWTAESGLHDVVALVDPSNELADGDRENNAEAASLTVASEDPGHAYEDVDNDALFTPGTDVKIPDREIHDGEYHVQDPWSLVIPAAVGPIDADAVNYTAGSEGHVVIETDVNSGDEGIRVEAGAYVHAEDVTFETDDEGIVLDAGDGPLSVNGSTFDTTDERIELQTRGDVHAIDASLVTTDERVIVDAGGAVNLTGSTAEAAERIPITAAGDVAIEDASLTAGETITIDTVDEAIVEVGGAAIADEDDQAVLTPEEATIEGEPAAGTVAHGGGEDDGGGGGQGNGKGK